MKTEFWSKSNDFGTEHSRGELRHKDLLNSSFCNKCSVNYIQNRTNGGAGEALEDKCSIHKHSGAGVSPGLALTLQPAGSSALLAIETAQEFGLELRVSLASCLLTLLQVNNNIEIYFFPFFKEKR